MKKIWIFIILALVVIFSFSLTLEKNKKINNLNQTSNSNPKTNQNIIIYHHEENSGIEEKDCFGGTCFTMDKKGPIYNLSGAISFACGKCSNDIKWVEGDIRKLKESGCVSGMRDLPGKSICFQVSDSSKWDVVFEIWSAAGSDEFKYSRSKYG
jgi:hypothetical protein